ncbi:chorismate-binding protein [Tenacibaculum maritimum]|uniref:chorismate-binding protein n=1 Tax=Tenacibaculum maritimum TaxID=107401 RepID=UPI0038762448
MNIFKHITTAYQKQLPFVVYRKPSSERIAGFFQKTDELHFANDYTEEGFVFAPFNNTEQSILIPKKKADYIEETIVVNLENTSIKSVDTVTKSTLAAQKKHVDLVHKGIKAIHKNEFKKVVLSRKESFSLSNTDFINIYQKLLYTYPLAMVYVWFHPKIGLWLGATPETLLKIKGNTFETMSLAGTQLYKETLDVTWSQKEIDEQQFVTDYIIEKLQEKEIPITASPPTTVQAGSLVHLCTKITGTFHFKNTELINALHPTPAVCGLPKKRAKTFILEQENYHRSFYTGFLGELNLKPNHATIKESDLYVNLRCMQLKNTEAHIFIGGGITKDSCPEKEWQETVSKANVMKKVL